MTIDNTKLELLRNALATALGALQKYPGRIAVGELEYNAWIMQKNDAISKVESALKETAS